MADIIIIETSPQNGKTNIVLDAYIKIVTSVPLSPQSITSDNVFLTDSSSTLVAGDLTYSAHPNGVYGLIGFSAADRFKPQEIYTLSISNLAGINGEELAAPVIVTFTTGEILIKSLSTPDGISFYEKKCYPPDGSNLFYWDRKVDGFPLESKLKARLINTQRYSIKSTVVGEKTWGTITPAGQVEIEDGSSEQFTISPSSSDYVIDKVYVDGVQNATAVEDGVFTFSNVMSPHQITAVFKRHPVNFQIEMTGGNGGVISWAGSPVEYGSTQTVGIAYNPGFYEYVTVTLNRGEGETFDTTVGATSFQVANIIQDIIVTIAFHLIPVWYARFDSTWFQGTNATWTGTNWSCPPRATGKASIKAYQTVHGTWNAGYRPSKMRLTFTGANYLSSVLIASGTGVTVYRTFNNVHSGDEMDMVGLPGNIGMILMQADITGSWNLTNIEFLD